MCLFIYFFFLSTFSWLLIRWYPPALCTCSCSPCFNEFAVLMNLGHISHYFRPLCQDCDRPYYALPFDDILYDVSCTCIVDYLVLILYNFDNKHTFIVIVIVMLPVLRKYFHGICNSLLFGQMVAISQTKFSDEFSWMKIFVFSLWL